jgi:molybdopterin-guanine dinucleotide biosynthesis protein B
MNRIHIIGRKNSGKTTLVVDLVRHFCSLGYRVGTIKHTHHHHELDTPGKDSYRHRQAGAMAVGIVAPTMNAVFWPAPNHENGEGENKKRAAQTLPGEASAVALDRTRPYAQLDALMAGYDLVLVEGDQQAQAIKIEVWHQGLEEPPLVDSNPSIALVVTNDPVHAPATHRRDDVPGLGRRLLELAGVGSVLELGAANKPSKKNRS